ncbi:MAG: peptidase S41 [bacterium]|nr:peptidase S41 [bacterium]
MLKVIKQAITVLSIFFLVFSVSASSPDQATNQRIENIKTFTRLYGYVKYFYPGDEAANMDWDRFAIYGVKRVEKAANRGELKAALEELFHPVTPALVIHETREKKTFSAAAITPPNAGDMKVTSWQHFGVGLSSRSIYRSARLNRHDKTAPPEKFGPINNSIDAAPYRGKEIKFKAALKVEKGIGQLWLRVDLPNYKTGFFNNMDDRPVKTSGWNHYEIIGTVDEKAVKIYYGCFLREKGKLWADDFQLYVREKGTEQWQRLDIRNPGFEKDGDGKAPAHWSYYDKDYTYLVSAASAAEGNNSLEIKSRSQDISVASGLFEERTAFGEHISKKLGSGLSCLMPLALYCTKTQTFPKASESRLKQLKDAIKTGVPETLSADNEYVRFGSLVVCWNVMQHFYPYFDVSKTDWEAELTKALSAALSDKTPKDFQKTLQKLIASLKDGHGGVYMPKQPSPKYYPPISLGWVRERLVVTAVHDDSIASVRAGDVVVAIDGTPAKDAMEREKQYISAATRGWLHYRLMRALIGGPKDSPMKLNLLRDGKALQTNLQRGLTGKDYYGKIKRKIKSKKLEDGIYYLNLDQIPMEEITKLMPQLQKARAIICDLRGYPKGNHRLISHLLTKPDTSDAWMRIPRVIYPDYKKVTYRNSGWNMQPVKPHLTAKMVFITHGRAISYAESFMGLIDHYNLAVIVGQPTAGTNGNVNPFTLPGGYTVQWTGMRVVRHDGSQHHGIGIIPDVPVERTIKGIKAGRDEFLEKAIEVAKR